MQFTLKLDRFEGPYTKLLDLIESRKLSITEISLVDVADEYIAYIKTLDQKNIIDISQFIVVASTLMLMKAKSLLPAIVYTEDEEKQVHDLEYKLELYALLTQASLHTRGVYGSHVLYSRSRAKITSSVFVPDARITTAFLQSIVSLTLMSFLAPKALVKVAVEQAMRLEHVIENLVARVRGATGVSLQSLAENTLSYEEKKKVLIVNFIALLELLRTGALVAQQHTDGGDIIILQKDTITTAVSV